MMFGKKKKEQEPKERLYWILCKYLEEIEMKDYLNTFSAFLQNYVTVKEGKIEAERIYKEDISNILSGKIKITSGSQMLVMTAVYLLDVSSKLEEK